MAGHCSKGYFIEQLPYAFTYHKLIVDEDGKPVDSCFVRVNSAFEKITGLTREEVVGEKLTRVFPEIKNSSVDLKSSLGQAALQGKEETFEHYHKGEDRWYELTAFPGDPGFFAVVFHDITSRKKAEQEAEDKNTILTCLNEYSLQQAQAKNYKELPGLILRQLKEFSDAVFGVFSEYDREKKALIIREIETHGKILDTVTRVCGNKLMNVEAPVDEDLYREMTTSIIGSRETLAEASQGVVPEEISRAIQKLTGLNFFIGLAHMVDGKLYGVSMLGFKKGQQMPSEEFLESFAHVSAISLRREKAEEEIRYISFHDSLTGLKNRDFLTREMETMDAENHLPVSIVMVDLNGLKLVNDSAGQKLGDRMLKTAAEILNKVCRRGDVLGRWGGDEFVFLLPQTDKAETTDICKKINKLNEGIYVGDFPVSMAAGFAVRDDREKDLMDVFKEAEDNMYKNKLAEDRSIRSTVLDALLKTLETKSYETGNHTRTMQSLAQKIGEKFDLPEVEQKRLAILISLHDIGKINIPEEILTKKGPLNGEEWKIIKKHPETGYRITVATDEFAHVAEEVLSHHERWDGMGYPRGLKGKEIPLLARITSIVDAYEVMSNGRPYKKSMVKEEIIQEFKNCAGTQFDPNLVDVFLEMLDREGPLETI